MKLKDRRQSKNFEDRTGPIDNKLNFMESIATTFHGKVAPLKKLKSAKEFIPGMDKAAQKDKEQIDSVKYKKYKFLNPKSIK